jgi:hypothetical protein
MDNVVLQTGVVWGGILAAGMVAFGLGFRLTKRHWRSRWGWGFYLMPVAAVVAAQMVFVGKGGEMPFGIGMGLAAVVSGLGCAAYGLFVFLFNRFVDDSLIRSAVSDRIAHVEKRVADEARQDRYIARARALSRAGTFAFAVTVQLVVLALVVALMTTLVIG